MADLRIRPAAPGDAELLHRFVIELVQAEQYDVEVISEPADLDRALFGDRVAEAVVGEVDGERLTELAAPHAARRRSAPVPGPIPNCG